MIDWSNIVCLAALSQLLYQCIERLELGFDSVSRLQYIMRMRAATNRQTDRQTDVLLQYAFHGEHARVANNTVMLATDLSSREHQLPSSLRQPHFTPSVSVLPIHSPTTSSHSVNSPLSPSITPSLFHSRLKTYLFHKSFPP